MASLSLKHINKTYPNGFEAVKDFNLEIEDKEFIIFVGPSGCGKSTTGRTILRLIEKTDGQVLFNGKDVYGLSNKEMRDMRTKMQIIFQDPYSSLNPRMTVGQIIGEGLMAHNIFKKGDPKMQDYIMEIMEKCGLASYFIHRYPHQFSGGQRQRIGIARSLAVHPKFVVCDEAVSALDVSIQSQVVNMLEDMQEQMGLTYLFIAHDLSVVKHISDRIGVMYLGKMVELADSYELVARSLHPYTKSLISAIPIADPIKARASKRIVLQGDVPSPLNPPTGCRFRTRCPYADECCAQKEPEWREVEKGHYVACHHVEKINA